MSGPLAIILSNIVLCLSLLLVRHFGDSNNNVLLLIGANGAAGVILLIYTAWKRRLEFTIHKPGLLLWVSCYAISYFIFVFYKEHMSLSQFVLSQAIAPYLGLLLSPDKFASFEIKSVILYRFIPFALLILIGLNEAQMIGGFNVLSAVILFVTTLLQALSQVGARYVKSGKNMNMNMAIVTMGNALGLLFFAAVVPSYQFNWPGPQLVFIALILALVIIIIQVTFLYGLKHTSGDRSVVMISTIVPLSLFFESMQGHYSLLNVLLSLLYLFIIWQEKDQKNLGLH